MDKRILAGAGALLAIVAVGSWVWFGGNAPQDQEQASPSAPAGELTAEQFEQLGIRTEAARDAGALPLGTVPGQVTLPPDARVAVTAPFAGAAVRLFVIEGQKVRRGQPLGVIRAAQSVEYGAALSRSQAELGLAEARAKRLNQLAEEGIVAGARADEANAQLRQAQASVAENRRLLALGGAGPDGTMTLRAPIAGRVAHVAIETGGPVDGMTAPFVIENTSAYRLDLQLPERIAQHVRPGMGVEVKLPSAGKDGEPLTVSGSILSVAASLDPMTRSVMAKASIASAPGLVAGKGVMVVIKGSGATGGTSVPSVAVTRIDGQDYVFVSDGPRFSRRKVTVAAEAGGRSVIGEGLKPGERVAVNGVAELKAMLAE